MTKKQQAIANAFESEYAKLCEQMDNTQSYLLQLRAFVKKYPNEKLEKVHEDNVHRAMSYTPWMLDKPVVAKLKKTAWKCAKNIVKKEGVEKWLHQ